MSNVRPQNIVSCMRYVVVGTSGSGKSTFARKLSAVTHAPYIELDELHWSENWTPRPREEFEDRVRRATSGEGWVVDGNYSVIRPIVWSKATHVVWLNFARSVVFSRIVWRTLRRAAAREMLWHGNRESFSKAFLSKESILLWSFTTYSKNVAKYTALRESNEHPQLVWAELRSPGSALEFLRTQAGSGA